MPLSMNDGVLQALAETLEARKLADAAGSYVASLYQGGDDAILKKVGEEATEVILAAKGPETGQFDADHLVMETADLWFHCMVLLAHKNIDVSAVLSELDRRSGRSGLTEKAERNTKED